MAKVSNEVLQRYKNKTYEYFRVEFRKETEQKADWQQFAKDNNLSMNKLILKAVDEYISNHSE